MGAFFLSPVLHRHDDTINASKIIPATNPKMPLPPLDPPRLPPPPPRPQPRHISAPPEWPVRYSRLDA
jgi:hypothetical protein